VTQHDRPGRPAASIRVIHLAPPIETTSRKRRGFAGGLVTAVDALLALRADDLESLRITRADEYRDITAATRPDIRPIVHTHHALLWPEARALAAHLGASTVYTAHILQARQSRLRGLDPTTPTRSEALEAQALAEATRVTVATRAALAILREDHPTFDLDKSRLASFAPNLPLLPRAPAPHPTVLAATRFDPLKGIDLLLPLAASLLTDPRLPTLRFILAGGLPENPRAERRWLDALEADLPEDARGRLVLPGWLSPPDLAAALATAHVYVSASRIETLGLGLLEALAAGCPAVATDLPVHREVAPTARLVAPTVDALRLGTLATLATQETPGDAWARPFAAPWLDLWRELAAAPG